MAHFTRYQLVVLLVAGIVFWGLVFLTGCQSLETTHFYENGVVASTSPIASAVGVDVMTRGGNAFDAAVAVGLTLAVVYPQAGNLGGGGFAVIRNAGTDRVHVLDFRETAPLAAMEDMFIDDTGSVIVGLSTHGSLSVGIPGTVDGLHQLWEKYGSLPWENLVNIAASLADSGFAVDQHLADAFARYEEGLRSFPETAELFFGGDQLPQVGQKLVLKDLATTLYLVAAEGPEAFYSGEIAEKIVACMNRHGGIITKTDLEQYESRWRQPLHFTFDSLDIFSVPPPSSGGIMLAQILKLLEPFDFKRYGPSSPEYIHLFCEACRLVYADRSVHLGDPDFYAIPDGLLDPEYLAERRDQISLTHAGSSHEVRPGNPGKYESDETTHFSICDREGNMVAVTTTLNAAFGSKLVVDGCGFLLNNEMDDFSIRAGHPNLYGLVGGKANKVEPGKRMLSSMTPTLVFIDNRPCLILGSPGGSKIITTVAQAVINFTRFGLLPKETVSQARFHHQWLPDLVYLEKNSFDVKAKQALIRMGHHIEERSPYGDLQMIYVGPFGLMTAASDPREGGCAVGY